MSYKQTISNKKGEVNFRKKLLFQFEGGHTKLKGQPTQKEYTDIIRQRINETRCVFKTLQQKKISFSPFLEIGAERGQRSLLLANEFNANGAMCDISLDSLTLAKDIQRQFGFKKIPLRICCDAYSLPFRANSIRFLFYFQTLHHFPNPKPVLDEAHRVLRSDGHLYFNEEPIRQLFNLNLWRRDFHLNPFEKLLKYTLLLPFISTIGRSEIEHGILEESFWLDVWEQALSVFETGKFTLKPIFVGPKTTVIKKQQTKTGWLKPNVFITMLLALQGGGIEGLCGVKKDAQKDIYAKDIMELLACPTCDDRPRLSITQSSFQPAFSCNHCKTVYPKQKDVYMILPKKELKTLYS